MKRFATALLVTCVSASAAHAAVVVTDNVLTAPTLGADDTGYTAPTTTQRFGWNTNEGFTQTFTTTTAGTIGSIYLGYNAFDDGDTITLNLSVNGSTVQNGIVLDGDNFSGQASGSGADGNSGPHYWMEFDLSTENVSVIEGSNSFTLLATATTGNSWAFAPRFSQDGDPYSGGVLTSVGFSTGAGDDDMAFAVTVVPEPSSLALLGLGGLLIARRRRG